MAVQTEWWENFFSGLWLDVQRHIWPEDKTRADAEFLEEVLQLEQPARVLDVPCGEGRLALELAAHGYQVTGVDITLPLLEDARRKASERQLEIEWEHRDMRDLPWRQTFDAALCFWGSFGYFDEAGNLEFARAVCRALRSGGKFLIDTHIAETLLPKFQRRGWDRIGDTVVLEERHYNHADSSVDVEWTFMREGRENKRSSSIRVYTYRELCQLLQEAGFDSFEGYDTVRREPFEFGARRLCLVAAKNGG